MPKLRVLIVDDSVVFRRVIADALADDPALEVAGTAPNGRIALAKLPQLNPDLVILDIEMPEMDGLATLAELRKSYPRLPVIMFSALTERGAEATLNALALGASDYFPKPAEGGPEASLQVLRDQLIPKIKALCKPARATVPLPGGEQPSKVGSTLFMTTRLTHARLLAIGASTGGPNALAEIFTQLPADFPLPIVVVQHMPPLFTRLLAERLSAQSALRVREGTAGTLLEPGCAWVAPGDYHMAVVPAGSGARLLLHQDPPENSCRPAVDVLLRSVAQAFGRDSLTVMLTGMGQDGLRGCQALREVGAQILVQDEASSVVWGMPGAVARAGLADRVLPLSLLAGDIKQRVRLGQSLTKK